MTARRISKQFPSRRHDHASCIRNALAEADRICRQQGLRLTPLRRRILEMTWQSHRPVTAYELLDRLVRNGHRAQAPTVYRCLDFLMESGLVHRVESLNAYIGCNRPWSGHEVGFFICEHCGEVAEISDSAINQSIDRGAASLDFTVTGRVVEVSGLCASCRELASE